MKIRAKQGAWPVSYGCTTGLSQPPPPSVYSWFDGAVCQIGNKGEMALVQCAFVMKYVWGVICLQSYSQSGQGIAEQRWKISESFSEIGNCVGVVSSIVGISGFFFFFL